MKKLIVMSLLIISQLACAKPATKQLSVALDGLPSPNHAPLLIAKQQGFFAEQGLDVTLLAPTSASNPINLISNHQADIAISDEPEFVKQKQQGRPIFRVGTLIDKPLNCIIALKSSGIHTLADLKGKRIGVEHTSGLSVMMLKILLAKQGLSDKEINMINVANSPAQALLTHQVDAITGVMRNFSVPALEAQGQELTTFFPEEHGLPNYSVLIFISHQTNAKDPRFPRFLAAIKKAVAYLDEHPQKSWDQFAKLYPDANNDINHDAWFATLPYFAENPAELNLEASKHFTQFMRAHHLMNTESQSS
jgi:putative hydroxymethylpyrimidine transport system substrate-binding protein